MVNVFASGCDKVRTELANRIEYHIVVGNRLVRIGRSRFKLTFMLEFFLLQIRNLCQVQMPEQKPNIIIICIKVSHL